jgi:MurNAc alpha-1-phosphate uridylyltransferase
MSGIENCKAMIFAAGLGTRLKPFTDHHPKALVKVNGKSLLERNIDYLRSFGIREFVINTFHFSGQIHLFLAKHQQADSVFHVSYEETGPYETGGGLAHAAKYLKEDGKPFVVMNADILTDLDLRKMFDFHMKHAPLATLAITNRESSRQFLFDEKMKLCGWRNNKTNALKMSSASANAEDLSPFSFSGVHIIDPNIFERMPTSGIYSITDTYLDLAKDQLIMGYDHSGGIVLDVGKPEALAQASTLFP